MEEFEGMKRKQLQALCKKHGIPANKSNLEMARLLDATLNKPDEVSSGDSRKLKRVRFSPENDIREYEPSCYKQMARRRSLRGRQVVIEEQCCAGGVGVGVPNMKEKVSLCEVLESESIPKPLKTNFRRKDDLSKTQDSGDVGKAETVEGGIRTRRMRAKREARASQVTETEIVVLEDGSRLSDLSRNPSRPKSRRDLGGNTRLEPTQQAVSWRVTRSRAETEIVVLEDDSSLSNLSRNPSRPKSMRDLGENTRLEPTQQVVSRRVTRSRAEPEIVVLEYGSRLCNLSRNPSRPKSRRDLGENTRLEPSQQVVSRRVTRCRAKVAGDDSVLQKGEAGGEELDVRKETKKRLRSPDVEVETENDTSRGEIENGGRPVGNLRSSRRKGSAVDELGIGETRLESLLGNPQRRSTRQTSRNKLVEPSVNQKTTSREQRGVSSLPIVIENDEPSANYHGPTIPEVSTYDHLHLSDKNRFTNCDSEEGFGKKSNETISIGVVDVAAMCSDKERNADASVSLQKTCSPASLNLVGASSGQKTSQDHGEPMVLKEAEIDGNMVFDGEQKCVAVADNMDKGAWSLGYVGFGDVKLVETDLTGSQTQTQSPLSLNVDGSFPVQGTSEAERKPFVVCMPELCPAVFAADAKKLVGDEIVDKSSPSDGGSDSKRGQDLRTGSCSKLEGGSSEKETSDFAIPLVLSELETGPNAIVDQAGQDGNFEFDFNDGTCPLQTAPVCIMDNSVEPQPEEFQMSPESPKFAEVVGSQQTLEIARASAGLNEESKTNFIDDPEKLVTFGIAENDVESIASFAKDRGLANVELTGTDVSSLECMTLDRNGCCYLGDGIPSNQEGFAGLEEAPGSSPDFEENVTERIEASCQGDDNLFTPLEDTAEQLSEVKSNLLLEEKPSDLFNSGMIYTHEILDEGEIYQSGPDEKGTAEDANKLVGDEIVDKSSPSGGGSDAKPEQDLHPRSCSKLGGGSSEKETSDIAREPLVLSELETGPNVIVDQAYQDENFELDFNDGTCPLQIAPVCIKDNSVEPQPEEFQMSTESPNFTEVVGSQQASVAARASVGLNEESKTNFIDDSKKLLTFGIAENDVESRASFAEDRGLVDIVVDCRTSDPSVCSLEDGISSNQEDFAGLEEPPENSPDFEENVTERIEVSGQVDDNLFTPVVETIKQVSELKSNMLFEEKHFDLFNPGMIYAIEPLDEGEIYQSGPEGKGTDEDAKKLHGDEIVDKSSLSDGGSDAKPGQDLHARSCSKLGGGSSEKETSDIAREPLVLSSELETGPNVIVGQADQDGNCELDFSDGTCPLQTAPVCIMDNSVVPQPEELQIDTASPTLRKLLGSQHRLEVARDSSVGYNEESKTNFEDDLKKLVTNGIAEVCSLMSPNSSDIYLDQETPEAGGEEIDHDIVGDRMEKVLTVTSVNHDSDYPRAVVNMTCSIKEITAEPDLAEFQTKDLNVSSPKDVLSSGNQADFAGIEKGLRRSLSASASARRDLSRESDDDMGHSDEVNRLFSQEFGTCCGTEKIQEGVATIAEEHKLPQDTRASSAVKEVVTETTEGSCKVDNNLFNPFLETGEHVSDVKSTHLLGEKTFDKSELSGKVCVHEHLDEEEIYQSGLEENGADEATGACIAGEHDEHQQDSVYKETYPAGIIPPASQDEQSGDTSRPLKLEGNLIKLEFKVSKLDDFSPYALSGGVSPDCEDSVKKADALDTDEEMNGVEMNDSAVIPSEDLLPIDDLRSMDACNEDEQHDPVTPQVPPVEIIELPTPQSSRKEAMKKASEGEILVDGKTETAGVSELITSLPVENKDSELDMFCGLENVEENAAIVEPASVQVAREKVEELSYSCIDELVIEVAGELKNQNNVLAKTDESQGSVEQQHPSLTAIDEAMCYETEFLRQQSNMHDRVDSIQGCQNYEDESLTIENSHAASFEQSEEHDPSSKLNQEEGANLSPKEAVGSSENLFKLIPITISGLEEKGADEATGACRTGEHDEHQQDSVYEDTCMENSIPLASQDEQSGDTSRPLKLEGNLIKLEFKVSKLDDFSPSALSGGVSPDCEDSVKNLKEPVHNVLELDAKADALDTDEEMNGIEIDDSAITRSEDLPIDDLRSMDACNEDEQCDPVVTPQVTPVETIELPTHKSSRNEAMTKSAEGELLVDGKTETAGVSELITSFPVENKDSELDIFCDLENVEENAAIVEPSSVQVAREQVEELSYSFINELIMEVADELKKQNNVLAKADERQGSVEQQHRSLTAIDEAMCYETESLRQKSNMHDGVDIIQGCQNYEDESLNVENSHAAAFHQSEEHDPSGKLNQEEGANLSPKEAVGSSIAVVGDQMTSPGAETEGSNSLVRKQMSSSMNKVFYSDMKENMLEGTKKRTKIGTMMTPKTVPNRRALEDLRKN